MVYERLGELGLDYAPCRYGTSRLHFRGPAADLSRPYVAFLGAAETYGKFVPRPFPELLGPHLGCETVNLGLTGAGPDVFSNDPVVLTISQAARATVLQVPGALNLSNRLYRVHPRRNDRFISASERLRTLFPEIDFAEINFTGHLANRLRATCPDRFETILAEIRTAWIHRMQGLASVLDGPVILLWAARRAPGEGPRRAGPAYVTEDMLAALDGAVAAQVVAVESAEARAETLSGKIYGEPERLAAEQLPGPRAHDEIARALEPVIRGFL